MHGSAPFRPLSVRAPTLCDVTFPAPGAAAPQLNGPQRPAPGPAADEGLARRLRALACTAPLHDLDVRKANLAGEYGVYAMAEVALAVIDLVTLNMDFDTGADHEEIVARVLPRVAAQASRRPAGEHERVARWVLENLINVGSVDRGFRAVYGTFTTDGEYVRRDYDFKLIEEVPGAGGTVYLRATDEAVNVLVGALDTDVTSAQIAAEVKLEVLINRGRLADAQLAAEQARYRTVQYAETLRRTLDATRRNVRAVDWLETVPDMINEALDHVADRYRHENAILTNIRKARDETEEPEHKRRAAELVDIVKDCIRRHTQLQSRLLEAARSSAPSRTGRRSPPRSPAPDSICTASSSPPCCRSPPSRPSGSPTPSSPTARACARPPPSASATSSRCCSPRPWSASTSAPRCPSPTWWRPPTTAASARPSSTPRWRC